MKSSSIKFFDYEICRENQKKKRIVYLKKVKEREREKTKNCRDYNEKSQNLSMESREVGGKINKKRHVITVILFKLSLNHFKQINETEKLSTRNDEFLKKNFGFVKNLELWIEWLVLFFNLALLRVFVKVV